MVADLGSGRSEEFAGLLAAQVVGLGRAAVLGATIAAGAGAEGGERAILVVAVPAKSGLDAAAALRAALPSVDGRGRGTPTLRAGPAPKTAGLAASLAAAASSLAAISSARPTRVGSRSLKKSFGPGADLLGKLIVGASLA